VPPLGAGGNDCGVIDIRGRLVLSYGHQCISQTQRTYGMRFRRLRDLDKRLVKGAAPQGDKHAFRDVEDPRTRSATILRPASRVHLAVHLLSKRGLSPAISLSTHLHQATTFALLTRDLAFADITALAE
jgi:hypothetical protein